VRCPSQEKIEQLAAGGDDPALLRLHAHLDRCPACRQRLEQAQADLSIITDIRELTERREQVKPLVNGTSAPG
jgi:predicted anti-sigma-YlaC factor YlaD